jgi:hypothetical protein
VAIPRQRIWFLDRGIAVSQLVQRRLKSTRDFQM